MRARALVLALAAGLTLATAAPSQALEWEEVATGVLVAERIGLINLSGVLGPAPTGYAEYRYRGIPPYGCDARDAGCRAARAYQEGVDRALRERAARAEREAREQGYCDAGGWWCRR